MKYKQYYNKNYGMTLVEVLVALAIFVVIMGAVITFQINVFSYERTASGSFITVQDAQTILKVMGKELRMASQGGDGSYAIQGASTSTVTFFADINNDNKKEKVKYYFSKSTSSILKTTTLPTGSPATYSNINTSTTTIMVNVRNATSTPMFEYFDSDYNGSGIALTQPVVNTSIRLIRVNITLDTDPNKLPEPRTYSTQITLRNLKDNL
ncbi:MAG: prepilin-type N-terminal cleavage/methylation domain-containing protein [Candidatus Paceibacterota bacterium]|jgi:prepilin-type N-terminal cleavage/methylation domain-containing protein